MKRVLLLALMCAFAGAASAQTKMVRLTRFEGLDISGLDVSRGIKAEVFQSDKTYATIEMPVEYENYIIFQIDGAGTVKIGVDGDIERGLKGLMSLGKFRPELIKAKVYVKSLSRIQASTSADVVCSGIFYSDNVDIQLSTSARLSDLNITVKNEVNLECSTSAKFAGKITTDLLRGKLSTSAGVNVKVQARSVEIGVNTSARMEISGFTESLKVSAGSSGVFMGSDLNSKTADLNSSSSGKIIIGETEELLARANSSGSIRYNGSPKHLDVNSSSGGSINRVN